MLINEINSPRLFDSLRTSRKAANKNEMLEMMLIEQSELTSEGRTIKDHKAYYGKDSIADQK